MTRAVLYTRVSTAEQANEGVSLDAQEASLRAYCGFRGLEVAHVIREEGVSAYKPLSERHGGKQLLGLVESGAVQAIVGYKLDRLFRNTSDALENVKQWDQAGVSLHLTDLGGTAVDTASATGKFFLTILASLGELERNLVSERTRHAMAHLKSQGKKLGHPPYGKNEEERAMILQAKALHEYGYGYSRIARELTSMGYKTRKGTAFRAAQVMRLVA